MYYNHYMYECARAKPITAATVDKLAEALLAAKAEEDRAIALAEATADALAPIAHYKKVDVRAGRVVAKALSGASLHVYSRPRLYGKDFRQVSVIRRGGHFTQIWINLIGEACTVADLIAGLRACEPHRKALRQVEQQFAGLEELLEAEERIRTLMGEIQATRAQMAERLLGASPIYYHDMVRNHLPGIAGRE